MSVLGEMREFKRFTDTIFLTIANNCSRRVPVKCFEIETKQ